jgi:hypothetical protein
MLSINAIAALQGKYGSAIWYSWSNLRWPQYDYARYSAAGITSLSLFTVAQGGVDPVSSLTKTAEQTSMISGGTFGQVGQLITQIRTHALILPLARQHATIRDDADVIWTTISNMMSKFAELLRRGVLQVFINNKEFFTISEPFTRCPPGFGVRIQQHAASYISGFTKFAIWAQQSPRAEDIFDLNPPQFIEPSNTFQVQLNYFDGTGPVFTNLVSDVSPSVDIGVILDGFQLRPTS